MGRLEYAIPNDISSGPSRLRLGGDGTIDHVSLQSETEILGR